MKYLGWSIPPPPPLYEEMARVPYWKIEGYDEVVWYKSGEPMENSIVPSGGFPMIIPDDTRVVIH